MLHIDGFEQFKSENQMSMALARAGYSFVGGQFTPLAGRFPGGQAIQVWGSDISREFDWPGRYFSAGFAAYSLQRGRLLKLRLGSFALKVSLDPITGIPMMNEIEGGSIPWTKYWYYFEVQLDRTAGTAALWINGRVEIPAVTIPADARAVTSLWVDWGSAALPGENQANFNTNVQFDDIYATDAVRLGPIAITTRFPTSSGPVEWEKSPDAPSNHAAVSKLKPDPPNMNVAAGALNMTDFYQTSTELIEETDVVATGLCVLTRKSPVFDAMLGVFIGDLGTPERRDLNLEIDGTWTTRYATFTRNIDDTPDIIEAAPFGIYVASHAGIMVRSAYAPDFIGAPNAPPVGLRYDAGFDIRANRMWRTFRVGGGNPTIATGPWLAEDKNPADYEVRATRAGGEPAHRGTFDTWLPCNQTNQWHSYVVDDRTTLRFAETFILLEWRLAGTTDIVHTTTVKFQVGIPPN